MLWVLIRSASVYAQPMFLWRNKKNFKIVCLKKKAPYLEL